MILDFSFPAYRLRQQVKCWSRAFAYATCRLSPDDAQDIILDCRPIAGWYDLMCITPDDVLDHAVSLHGDRAHLLKAHLHAACDYAARKWEAGDDYYSALGFALDMAREFAAQDGIEIEDAEENSNHEGEQADA